MDTTNIQVYEIYMRYADDGISVKEAINLYNKETLVAEVDKVVKSKTDKEEIKKWFSTQYVKGIIASDMHELDGAQFKQHTYKEGEPSWANKDGIFDFVKFSSEFVDKIGHIIDFLSEYSAEELKSLYKETYQTILAKVKAWDDKKAADLAKGKKRENPLTPDVDYKHVKEYSDGTKWVRLLTKAATCFEGPTMGHCVGGGSPDYDVTRKGVEIYSLYDANDMPHITIQVKNKDILQVKGKQNAAPVEKYLPKARDFVEWMTKKGYVLAGDAQNIGYFEYDGKFYPPEEYDRIHKEVIQPKIDAKFKEIYAMIKEV